MKRWLNKNMRWMLGCIACLCFTLSMHAQTDSITTQVMDENQVDVKEIVFGHILDSYEWHITKIGHKELIIPLPIIVRSKTSGWHVFLSSKLEEHDGSYEGFSIAPIGTKYERKIVEYGPDGEQIRPFDISLTKIAFALVINSILLIIIVLCVAGWYRKRTPDSPSPKGFVGFMEMFVMMINDDVINSCIGPRYQKFADRKSVV